MYVYVAPSSGWFQQSASRMIATARQVFVWLVINRKPVKSVYKLLFKVFQHLFSLLATQSPVGECPRAASQRELTLALTSTILQLRFLSGIWADKYLIAEQYGLLPLAMAWPHYSPFRAHFLARSCRHPQQLLVLCFPRTFCFSQVPQVTGPLSFQ